MGQVHVLNATVTVADSVINPGVVFESILNTVRRWGDKDCAVRVAANGSQRTLDMAVELEIMFPSAGSYHIVGGYHDALVGLSNRVATVEVHGG